MLSLLGICIVAAVAQSNKVEGVVMEETKNGKFRPLEFVHVYTPGNEEGVYSDSTGRFSLVLPANTRTIVVRYVGYAADTLKVEEGQYLNIVLKDANVLDEVEVKYRKRTTEVSYLDPLLVQSLSEDELFKAACCNLSESFETNASVDVNFTDAVTGAKEIRMLGLSGRYSMLSQEFMPGIRGIAIPFGLLYTPGTWIESIQITKGAGSVVNGFESIAGQINVELKKPEGKEQLYLNGYINEGLRSELNANFHHDVSPKLKTSLLLHTHVMPKRFDRNGDTFADMPFGHMYTAVNRWKYNNQKGLQIQLGLKYLYDTKTGGQLDYERDTKSDLYGIEIDANRFEAWGKVGYIFPFKRYQSLGFQWSYTNHNQDGLFGAHTYTGKQETFYANLIFQSIIGSSDHQYKLGASILRDNVDEAAYYADLLKRETATGVFLEYTYNPGEQLTVVGGLRVDYHSIYDVIWTPRIHLRYAPAESIVMRASAGKGFRSANVIAENMSLLASSRVLSVSGDDQDWPLGLPIETAWNWGVSLTSDFTLDYRPGFLSVDFYRTVFDEQVVVDLDRSPQQANLYPLRGQSWSNSFMAELSYEVLKRLEMKLAYRFQDVQTDYSSGRLAVPFVPKHRGFLNLAYTTRLSGSNKWSFDVTLQWTGPQRIPNTASNPAAFQLNLTSPDFMTVQAQVTKQFGPLHIYIGSENLTNFMQRRPILAPGNPFGPYFDSTLIWGPVFGRNTYFGIRYQIRSAED